MGKMDAKRDAVPGREKGGARELEPRRSFGIGGAGNIRSFSSSRARILQPFIPFLRGGGYRKEMKRC
jgi:hypothetical protein